MNELKATGLGMIAGTLCKVITNDIFSAVAVAFLTGAAAYAGQQVAKWVKIKGGDIISKINKKQNV